MAEAYMERLRFERLAETKGVFDELPTLATSVLRVRTQEAVDRFAEAATVVAEATGHDAQSVIDAYLENARRQYAQALAEILDAASSEAAEVKALYDKYGVESLEDGLRASWIRADSTESSSRGWLKRWTWGGDGFSSEETEFVQILQLAVQHEVAIAWGVRPPVFTPVTVVVPGPVIGELVEWIRRSAIDSTASGLTDSAVILEVPKQHVLRFPPGLRTAENPVGGSWECSVDDENLDRWSWDGTASVTQSEDVRIAGFSGGLEASIAWCIDQLGALIALVAPTDLVGVFSRMWREQSEASLGTGKGRINLTVTAPVTRLFPAPVEVLAGMRKPELDGTGPHSLQSIAASLDEA